MKKIKRTGILFSLFALLFALSAPQKYALAATESLAECVAEVSSRRVLYEKNGERELPMASTTKVLTAIIIIDDCNLDEEVIVPAEAAGVEGSSVYLRAGDRLTVRDLLYGLMLRSGNDCAVALALHHSGSIAKFAQKMNVKAAMLGAVDSRFVNPNGLPDKRHYTTARDLALISAYAMENETFCEIVSCKYYAPKNWRNKNKMLYEYDGAIGVKTGFTLNAGRCLVTSAQRGKMKLVSVVLNSPQMYERSAELLDRAFETYRMYELCSADEPYENCRVGYSFFYPLTKEERQQVEITADMRSPLPEKENELAGIMKITLENRLLFSQNLYIMKG